MRMNAFICSPRWRPLVALFPRTQSFSLLGRPLAALNALRPSSGFQEHGPTTCEDGGNGLELIGSVSIPLGVFVARARGLPPWHTYLPATWICGSQPQTVSAQYQSGCLLCDVYLYCNLPEACTELIADSNRIHSPREIGMGMNARDVISLTARCCILKHCSPRSHAHNRDDAHLLFVRAQWYSEPHQYNSVG